MIAVEGTKPDIRTPATKGVGNVPGRLKRKYVIASAVSELQ